MKKKQKRSVEIVALMVALCIGLAVPIGAVAQGAFVNLNFESPILPLDPHDPTGVPIVNALPSWAGYLGSGPGQVSRIFFDTVSLGGAAISLHDRASLAFQPLQGSYSVLLQGSGAGPAVSAAIGQVGQIPLSSLSLRFWADPRSNLQVTFGGQLIPLYTLSSTANYDVLGGDISLFAGQTAELRFTGPGNSGGYFDNITFSNQPIPEPSTVSLLGLGVLFLGCRSRLVKRL